MDVDDEFQFLLGKRLHEVATKLLGLFRSKLRQAFHRCDANLVRIRKLLAILVQVEALYLPLGDGIVSKESNRVRNRYILERSAARVSQSRRLLMQPVESTSQLQAILDLAVI